MGIGRPMKTTREVAGLLRVAESTVRQWIVRGELRAVRVGREYRVAEGDLDAFVEARATRPRDRVDADDTSEAG